MKTQEKEELIASLKA
jgi:chromosome segregation ATPase